MPILAALRLLTIIPISSREATPDEMHRAPGYFPLVGLLLGVGLLLLDLLLRLILPPSVTSALVLVALIAITGGLHLDGLADTCDGVFSAADPERRLEIMRDSRVGSYGVVGVVSALLVQYVTLAALPIDERSAALVLMTTTGRWAMTYALGSFPYARSVGLGSAFNAGQSTTATMAIATVTAGLAALLLGGLWGLLLMVVVWGTTRGIAYLLEQRLSGLTGDTYGAINEAIQTLTLLALIARP